MRITNIPRRPTGRIVSAKGGRIVPSGEVEPPEPEAPSLKMPLVDQSFVDDTGLQTYGVSGNFSGTRPITYEITSLAGVSINGSTGLITFDTDVLDVQAGTTLTVTATNDLGFAEGTFDLEITENLGGPLPITVTTEAVGGTLTIDSPQAGLGYYLEAKRPNATGFENGDEWLLQHAKDITGSGYTFSDIDKGLTLRVVEMTGNTTRTRLSVEVGPIDWASAPAGTTVNTEAEFNTAKTNNSITTVILAAGVEFDPALMTLQSLDRSADPLTITTSALNPAIIKNGEWQLDDCKGITLDGLWFYSDPANTAANGLSSEFLSAERCEGLVVNACRFYCDAVLPAVYQDTDIRYDKDGTGRPDYLHKGVDLVDSYGAVFTNNRMENVWGWGDFTSEITIDGFRGRGFYFDGFRFTAGQAALAGPARVADVIVDYIYSLYEEYDIATSDPHPDYMQNFGSNWNTVIEDVVMAIGDTRGAFNDAAYTGVNPMFINNSLIRNFRLRNVLAIVRGGTVGYFENGADVSINHFSPLKTDTWNGGSSYRIGTGTSTVRNSGENRCVNSYSADQITYAFKDDGYVYGVDDTARNVQKETGGANMPTYFQGAGNPRNAMEALRFSRPLTDTNKGAVSTDGYLRDLDPLPETPNVGTITATTTGFDLDINAVANADEYHLRHRLNGTEAWTTVWQTGTSFVVTGYNSADTIEYQFRAGGAGGTSLMSASATIDAGAPPSGETIKTRQNYQYYDAPDLGTVTWTIDTTNIADGDLIILASNLYDPPPGAPTAVDFDLGGSFFTKDASIVGDDGDTRSYIASIVYNSSMGDQLTMAKTANDDPRYQKLHLIALDGNTASFVSASAAPAYQDGDVAIGISHGFRTGGTQTQVWAPDIEDAAGRFLTGTSLTTVGSDVMTGAGTITVSDVGDSSTITYIGIYR